MNLEQVEKIAVLGAGVMGNGIAQIAAGAGYRVTIRDIAARAVIPAPMRATSLESLN